MSRSNHPQLHFLPTYALAGGSNWIDPLLCRLHVIVLFRYVLSTTYTINTSVQTTTKCQPFLLMFYRHPLGAMALNSQHDAEDNTVYGNMVSGVTAEDAHNNLQANISKVSIVNLKVGIVRRICRRQCSDTDIQ